jgi:hypothetical protein
MTARDAFLGLGVICLTVCTAGLIISTGFHWLGWLDGQAVGVGLLVASSLQDAT